MPFGELNSGEKRVENRIKSESSIEEEKLSPPETFSPVRERNANRCKPVKKGKIEK